MNYRRSLLVSLGMSSLLLALILILLATQHTYVLARSVGATPTDSAVLTAPAPTSAQQTQVQSVTQALDWLKQQQATDGGYGTVGATADVVLAFASAHTDLPDGIIVYLEEQASSVSGNVGSAGKLAQAVAAAGYDPRDFGEQNLVQEIRNGYNAAGGDYGNTGDYAVWTQAPAMLGLAAASEPIPPKAVAYLKSLATNGSWGGGDATGQAIQALIAAGEPLTTTEITEGIAYLKTQQQADGGFAVGDGESNSNTTGYAVQALLAAGRNPTGEEWTTTSGATPITYLFANQQDDGSIWYQANDPGFSVASSTRQAIPALVGRAFPFYSPNVIIGKSTGWIQSQYDGSTGMFTGWNPGASLDAVFALACTNNAMRNAGSYAKLPLDYFTAQAAEYAATSAASAGKMAMGVVIAGGNPRMVGDTNMVISMTDTYSPTSGAYGTGSIWDQTWAMFGMVAVGEPLPSNTVSYLTEMQSDDGGWGSVDGTAMAIQMLIAAGVAKDDPAITNGLTYLKAAQNHDGGWGYSSSSPATSASSTGLALQALAAAGEDPNALAWSSTSPTSLTLASPLDTLMALNHSDGGFKGYTGPNDPGATYMAVPGLTGCSFPPMPVNFTLSRNTGVAPLTVAFTNTSLMQESSVWQFGDEESSTTANPSHTYTTPGVYTVTLTSGAKGDTQTLIRSHYINVHAAATADFTSSVRSGVVSLTVTFTNTSSGDVQAQLWQFGDEQTSTAVHPTHTYTTAGAYTVTLTVSGTGGIDTATKGAYITVNEQTPEPVLPPPPPSLATKTEVKAAQQALVWLKKQQLDDGSTPGFGGNVGSTLDTVLAVAAANEDASTWRSSKGNSLVEYLRSYGESYAQETAAKACKLTVGVGAAGENPYDFRGLDLVTIVKGYYNTATGEFGKDAQGNLAAGSNWDQSWCILAYAAIGETVPTQAVTVLKERAGEDGSWNYGPQLDYAHVDTTGLVLQALAAGGEPSDSQVIKGAIAYLHERQQSNGGFADTPSPVNTNPPINTNSTVYAMQGLLAVGEDPLSADWTTEGISATHPISFVLGMQQSDGGFFWQASDSQSSLMATQQAMAALMGKPYPFAGRGVMVHRGTAWMKKQQSEDGSFNDAMGMTVDACLALAATESFDQVNKQAMISYMQSQAGDYANTPVAAGKLATCVVAAGADPTSFGEMNLVSLLQGWHNATTGAYGTSTWDQAWAMIGLVAAGETLPANTAPYLISMQNSNGGWGYSPSFGGTDTDSTGLVLQALAAAGSITDSTLTATGAAGDALDYLRATQNSNGGWGYSISDPATSANSTAYAIQGLTAAGENPSSSAWSMVSSSGDGTSQLTINSPLEALHALQSSEGGFQGSSDANDPMATYQALPGLNEVAFPIQQQEAVSVQSAFTANPLQGTAPLTVTFTNGSTGDYTTSLWAFGDGGQSWLTAPTHTYTQTGVFTATLTVSGPGGTSTESAAITVQEAPVVPTPGGGGYKAFLPLVQRSTAQ